MLTELTEREIIRKTRLSIRTLKRNSRPSVFITVMRECYAYIDTFIDSLHRGGVIQNLACRDGCSYCCFLPVNAHSYEIILIAEQIKTKWPQKEQTQLKRRIDRYIKNSDLLSPFHESHEVLYCPLLENHSCTIHGLRPMNCQAHHSPDSEDCRDALHGLPVIMQFDSLINEIYSIQYDAIRRAMEELELDVSQHNLVWGLKIALKTPNAAERYLRGEHLF
ncbi:MAG: hypothetical protein GC154_07115 [bacterium]|nr:hypothetical protein [bacterium]